MSMYDGDFVREIQKRHHWPVVYGPGPFQAELEGRVFIEYWGGGYGPSMMMVPRPEYESLPEAIREKLGTPLQALDRQKQEP